MDIHQLELFLAVMDSPSMTRAAEKIHLSPGAVSLQLHKLADELQTELFVRSGKRLIPTPAALRLAELAKQVVTMMGHIQQTFENDLTKDVRPFHFATGVTTLIHQLGAPLRQLRKRYPNAEIRVTVGVTEEMVAGLLERPVVVADLARQLPRPTSNSSRFLRKSFSSCALRQTKWEADISVRCELRTSQGPHFCSIRSAAMYGWSSTVSSTNSV